MSLSRVFPQEVGCTAGGRLVMVGEYTLGDLAALQTWLDAREPHPLADIPPLETDPEPETRTARLRAAFRRAKTGAPTVGTVAGALALNTLEGRVVQLYVGMARATPGVTMDDAMDLMAECTPEEWRAIKRVMWGRAAWREIADELAPEYDDPEPIDWAKSVHDLCTNLHWTPTQVAALTLSQWRMLMSGGRADTYDGRPRPGESIREAAERDARLFGYEIKDQNGTEPGA